MSEPTAEQFRQAIAERKAIYQTKLDQATTAQRFSDGYSRCDLFRHAVEAFEHLEADLTALCAAASTSRRN